MTLQLLGKNWKKSNSKKNFVDLFVLILKIVLRCFVVYSYVFFHEAYQNSSRNSRQIKFGVSLWRTSGKRRNVHNNFLHYSFRCLMIFLMQSDVKFISCIIYFFWLFVWGNCFFFFHIDVLFLRRPISC